MRKIGRNDPCPCGSGKKYKHCCHPRDGASRVVRLVDERMRGEQAEARTAVLRVVRDDLFWASPQYCRIAERFVWTVGTDADFCDVWDVVMCWRLYSSVTAPDVRKPEVYVAALEYLFGQLREDRYVTQKEIADKHGVTASAVSRIFTRIVDTLFDRNVEPPEWPQKPDGPTLPGIANGMRSVRSSTPFSFLNGTEKTMFRIAGVLEESGVARAADALEHDDWPEGKTPRDQAQELLYDAMDESSSARRVGLARQALRLYPDSPDAYNILAEEAPTKEEALAFYRLGIEAGERDLGPDLFRKYKGHFWGYIRTRPYMRSKFGYAFTCEELGRYEEAIWHYRDLLHLNPNDNQGARYRLLHLYFALKRLEEAADLLDQYDEYSTYWAFGWFMASYLRGADDRVLKKLWNDARSVNPHVPAYMLGKKPLPPGRPDWIAVGGESEAAAYVYELKHLGLLDERLRAWVRKQESGRKG